MTEETARLVFVSALGAGVTVWLLGLLAHRRAFRPADPLDPGLLRAGQVEVDAPTEQVRDRLVQALRTGAATGGGSVLIEEAGPDRIEGKVTLYARKGGRGGGVLGFAIALGDLAGRTAAAWRITMPGGGGGLLFAGRLFVYLLAPAALAAAAILVPAYVLGSDDPKVRAQAVQTLQVVHFVWPPFLIAWIRRRVVGTVETAITNLIRNTAF